MSLALFRSVQKHFPSVTFKRQDRFYRCETCERLQCAMRNARSSGQLQAALAQFVEHIDLVKREREVLYAER